MSDNCQGQKGQDLIWDYYQNESPESFEGSRARLHVLLSRIKPSQVVLNIGCGTGMFEEQALARKIDIHSLDPSERSIRQLREALHLGDKAQVGYIQQLPFSDAYFDVVVVSEVLEHLTPAVTQAGLEEIRRVLKPGGRILGTVPSREDFRAQIAVCPCCGKRFHKWGHEQSFDPEKMERLLGEYFCTVRVMERPIVPWSTLNWKGKCFGMAKALLWKLGIHGSNENLVFEGSAPAANRHAQ
jgi:ubiquinone/menaquinone biosynthesis C-methylase UbiE